MLRKDYLLQQIEMLSGMVARLLKLREDGDEQGAAEEIEQSYRETFGFEPKLISLLPSEFLFDKIRSGEYLDTTQGITLAVLLREDAMNFGAAVNALEHYQRLIRSLKVFLVVEHEHGLAPEQLALYAVDAVLDQMTDYELPADIKYDLFLYYEDTGEYARAEDMLHEALQASDSNQALIDEGISFYEWLLTLPDTELDAGNLPRDEVEEGLAQLKSQGA